MRSNAFDLLEYEPLRELVSRYLGSPMGKTRLVAAAPGTGREELEYTLAETGEAIEYLRAAAEPQTANSIAARGVAIRIRFESLPDPTVAAQKLRIEGAVLDGTEIFQLTELLDRAADVRFALTNAAERHPLLARRAASIGDFRPVLWEIAGKILPDGRVADDASVALNRIRRDIEKQQRLIQESLERFLRKHRDEGVLQEEYVTIRNERYVVPIIAGRQRRIDGVIHGASNTGQTLFVEPLETIQLNNDLVRLTEEEQREIHRILREITEKLRVSSGEVRQTVETLGELDLLFGKAKFAIDFDCTIPRFSPKAEPKLLLREARHPLLEDVLRKQKRRIVPISLSLDRERRTLLISGPNTGGKTVSMKTVGLLSLMAQSGLPVPAAEAEFPLFDQVLADIGDNQSIQESLSTFSAHIAQVRAMAEQVTPDSLVLLDELGRATDPEEGGALGVAILEHFRRMGAFTLASTHLLALKVYGANTPGVVNASMGFDDQTLEPTYILRLGAPGKSAGLDIASRLGMPPALIERARAAMRTAERDIARFLEELHRRIAEAAQLREELEAERRRLHAREQELAREWERRESAKIRELERRTEELIERFDAQARETIDGIIESAEQRKAADQARRKVAKAKREFQAEVTAAVRVGKAETAPVLRIEEGARVRLKGVREPARVRRKLSGDLIEVEAGFLRMQVSVEDVEEVLPETGAGAKLPSGVSFQSGPRWDVSYREINVIGQRAEEACDQVDKFLDSATMASVDRVRIVHGHGMGVLRKAIADLLSRSPHVEKFYPASPAEGGTGATIVELK